MSRTLLTLLFLLVAPLAARCDGAEAAVIDVRRGEPQLFVDDSRIAESRGLQRTLRQPKKDGGGLEPLLSSPVFHGHNSTLEANGTILFDPGLNRWVMYCLAFASSLKASEPFGWQRVMLVRFVSDDGLNWESGSPDGLECVFPRTREDLFDPVSGAFATNIDVVTIFYDRHDPERPYKAWFWLSNLEDGREGAYYHHSRDGRRWTQGGLIVPARMHKVRQAGVLLEGAGDTSRFAYDPLTGRFLALLKYYQRAADPITGNRFRSRTHLFLDSLEESVDLSRSARIDLVPPAEQTRGDFPFDEYYDSTAFRYGAHWLGELRIWHGSGDYPWSAAGCAYLKLMSSTDGLDWRRVCFPNDDGIPEVFIGNGRPEGGNNGRNDGGYMTNFSSGPLRIGDELIFYYGSSSFGKNHAPGIRLTGGGIFRARLRLDGFVSVDAGQLTTPRLRFDGEHLIVNSAGGIRVEVLDADGAVLGSARFDGNSVRHRVVFAGRTLAEVSAGRANVALRFTIEPGGSLYAFLIE